MNMVFQSKIMIMKKILIQLRVQPLSAKNDIAPMTLTLREPLPLHINFDLVNTLSNILASFQRETIVPQRANAAGLVLIYLAVPTGSATLASAYVQTTMGRQLCHQDRERTHTTPALSLVLTIGTF